MSGPSRTMVPDALNFARCFSTALAEIPISAAILVAEYSGCTFSKSRIFLLLFTFFSELLQERQEFGYPPFVRLVDITLSDRNPARASEMAEKLKERICRLNGGFTVKGPYSLDYQDNGKHLLRIAFPKDRNLSRNKLSVRDAVLKFEETEKYQGHITIDADPA